MKGLTIHEQRALYQAYKEEQFRSAHQNMTLLKTETDSPPDYVRVFDRAKADIMAYVAPFDDEIKEQARREVLPYPWVYS